MRIDTDYIHALKEYIAAQLPDRSFLQIDRGDALFITNAVVPEIPGFSCEKRGLMTAIRPTADYLCALESGLEGSIGDLSRSVEQFRGLRPLPNAADLFISGLKLLYKPTVSSVTLYDKTVRQYIAAALRARTFGGIFGPAVLADTLMNLYGGN